MKVKRRFIIGSLLFVVVLGYPAISMFRLSIQYEGWFNALKGLGMSMLFGGALGLSVWLILSGILTEEKGE